MAFRVCYHPAVVSRDIPRLAPPVRKRIQAAIEQRLSLHPEEFAKPLAYTRAGLWSLRVSSWRVIFKLQGEDLWILRIGHRREVYEALDREIPSS